MPDPNSYLKYVIFSVSSMAQQKYTFGSRGNCFPQRTPGESIKQYISALTVAESQTEVKISGKGKKRVTLKFKGTLIISPHTSAAIFKRGKSSGGHRIESHTPFRHHRCVSLKKSPLRPVLILKHTTTKTTEQTSMRTKLFKHVAI